MAQIFNESIVFRNKDEGIYYLGNDNENHSSFIPMSPSGNLLIGYGNFKDSSNTGAKATYIDGKSIYLRWTDKLNLVHINNGISTTLYKFNNEWSSFERKAYFKQGLSVRNQRAYFNEGLSSYNKGSYLYWVNTRGINIVQYEGDTNPVSLKTYVDNRIANHFSGSRVFYATCYSDSKEAIKKIRLRNPSYIRVKREDGEIEEKFALRHGDQLIVNFGYGNDAPSPLLKLYNGDGNYEISTATDVGHQVIVADKSTTGLTGAWSAGEIVTFTYVYTSGAYYWKINNAGAASRTRFGTVKLLQYWHYHSDIDNSDINTAPTVRLTNSLIRSHTRRLRLTTEVGATEYNSLNIGKQKITIHLKGYDDKWNLTEIDHTSFYRHLPVTKTSQLYNTGSRNNTENIDAKNITCAHYLSSNHSIAFDSYNLGIGYWPRSSESTDGHYKPDGGSNAKIINFIPYNAYGNVKLGHGSFKADYETDPAPAGSNWRIQKPKSYTKIYGHYIRLYIQSNGRDDRGDLHIDGLYYPYNNTNQEPTTVRLYQFSGTKMRFPPVEWPSGGVGNNHRVVFSFDYYKANEAKNTYRPLLNVYNGIRTGRVYASQFYIRSWDKNNKEKTTTLYKINSEGEAYFKYLRLRSSTEATGIEIQKGTTTTIRLKNNGVIDADVLKVRNIMVGENKNQSLKNYIRQVIANDAVVVEVITFDKITFKASSSVIQSDNGSKITWKDENKTVHDVYYNKDPSHVYANIKDYKPNYYPIGIVGVNINSVDGVTTGSSSPRINLYDYYIYNSTTKDGTPVRYLEFAGYNLLEKANTVRIRFYVLFRRSN